MKHKTIYLLIYFLSCYHLVFSENRSIHFAVDVFITENKVQENKIITGIEDFDPEEDIVRLIKEFYKAYATNILSSQYQLNDSLFRKYLTKRLIGKIDRLRTAIDADPIIRAQDFNERALKTLNAWHLEGEWYMVNYVWNVNQDSVGINIPLKVIDLDGQYLIDYITPEWNGSEYGNKLLCGNLGEITVDSRSPLLFLKSFYTAYISEYCHMPENLMSRLLMMRNEYLTPNALAQFDKAANEYKSDGKLYYDLLIDFFDFDCLWIPSMTFTKLDENTYQMHYIKWRNLPTTITINVIQQAEKYKIECIRIKK